MSDNPHYQSLARRADAMRRRGTPTVIDFWHGYRLGMVNFYPCADQEAKRHRLNGFTGERLRGYRAGLAWETSEPQPPAE